MADEVVTITIQTPDQVLFTGKVNAVSTYNTKGVMDILPFHENFISIIEKSVIVHNGKEEKTFPLKTGILQIVNGDVFILIGMPPFAEHATKTT